MTVIVVLSMAGLLTVMILSHMPKKKTSPQCQMCQMNKPQPAPGKSTFGYIALLIVLIIILAYGRLH